MYCFVFKLQRAKASAVEKRGKMSDFLTVVKLGQKWARHLTELNKFNLSYTFAGRRCVGCREHSAKT